MNRRVLLAVTWAIALAVWSTPAAAATQNMMELGLKEIYARIDGSNAPDADKQQQKLEAHQLLIKTAEVMNEQMEELQVAAARLHATGKLVGYDLGKLKELSEKLEKLNQSPYMKGLGAAVEITNTGSSFYEAYDNVTAMLNDKTLPLSARRSLAALHALGSTMKEVGGNVPVLGEALKDYGEIVTGLTKTVQGMSSTATGDLREGFFESETGELQGLPGLGGLTRPAYTDLWKDNIPIVEMRSEGDLPGTGKFYLQTGPGQWREVGYDAVAGVASDFMLMKSKMAAAADIIPLLDDDKKREALADAARDRAGIFADRARRSRVTQGLSNAVTSGEFIDAQNAVDKHIRDLGLLVDPRTREALLREYFENRARLWKAMQAKALALHPGLEKYLRDQGKNPFDISLPEMESAVHGFNIRKPVPAKVATTSAAGYNPLPSLPPPPRNTQLPATTPTVSPSLPSSPPPIRAKPATPTAPPAPPRCAALDEARKNLDRAEKSLVQSRDPKATSWFSCSSSMYSASFQEYGYKSCCETYFRDRSSKNDTAWLVMQQCNWALRVTDRRNELARAPDRCK